MRLSHVFRALCFASLCFAGATARAAPPDDVRGSVLLVSGTARIGGTVGLAGDQNVSLDYSGVVMRIVADPDHPDDKTMLQVNITIPAPATPCNTDSSLGLALKGTYDSTTGKLQATGSRPGDTFIDTGIVDTPGTILGNNQEIWADIQDITMNLNGVASLDAQNRIVITGDPATDKPPASGGPTTNLPATGAKVLWVPPGNCNPNDAVFAVSVDKPYGGFSWAAQQTSVAGKVTLAECTNSVQPITFAFRPTSGGAASTQTVTLAADGSYLALNIVPGTYDVAIKGSKWLQTVVTNVQVTSDTTTGVDATLRPGDINNDNKVNILDLGLLADSFGKSQGQTGFNPDADLNCDGKVNIVDLGVLADFFGKNGDP
jgi:hypothetical protein